jgi:predicted phosphate transport protein (TIGR00153 family)
MPPVYTARHDDAEIATIRTRHGPSSSLMRLTGYNVRMAFRLTPHERGFYPLFTRAAENIAVAADELAKLVATDPADRHTLAARVKEAELAGDEVTHEIMVKINTTFVTPFDREDIYRLASALDDVLDAIEEAADRIVLYRLGTLPDGIGAQVEVLQRAAAATAEAMPRLEKMAELQEYWIQVNSLENEADDIYRTLLGDLLAPPDSAPPADVLTVLKIKEVVETLEEAADAFETVANTVESIAVKEA